MVGTIKETALTILSKAESIKVVKEEFERRPDHSRRSLAQRVCEVFDLRDHRGRLRVSSCQVALRQLAARGKIPLPERRRKPGTFTPLRRLGVAIPDPVGLPERVDELADLQLVLVESVDQRLIWNELMATDHPQGNRRLVGPQVKYLFKSGDHWLGGAGLSSCALRLEARDKWLGWSDEQRVAQQHRVVNLNRFLIRRSVNCENLASCALGMVARAVGADYEKRYGYRPWVVESFVAPEWLGTCYQAANWKYLGKTKGRGRNDRYTRCAESVKDIYVYVVEKEFRELGGLPPEVEKRPALELTAGLGEKEWAAHEFGAAELGDQRLTKRLVKIAADRGRKPTGSYSEAVGGDKQELKAYYGFLAKENEEMTETGILSAHRGRTVQRIKGQKRVLAIQDTTDLNYAKSTSCAGLGVIAQNNGKSTGTKGLSLHSLFVVNDQGLPLGIGGWECYAPEIHKKGAHRNCLPIEEKESYRWLKGYRETLALKAECSPTQIVAVMDREGDIYEIFQEVHKHGNKVPVVIRAQHDRNVIDGEEMGKLFAQLDQSKRVFTQTITVPVKKKKAKKNDEGKTDESPITAGNVRPAELTISYEQVMLAPPATALKKGWEPLTVAAVYVREKHPPLDCEVIGWLLLTTLEVTTAEQALEVVKIYRGRWRIEEYHRVLKSGCQVESHRQRKAEKLRLTIAIDMVIAWRIMLLTLLGRESPQLPCDLVFTPWEWQALSLAVKKKYAPARRRWAKP